MRLALWGVILTGMVTNAPALPPPTQPSDEAESIVVLDKTYTIVNAQGNEEIGAFALTATETDNVLSITSALHIQCRGQSIGLTSTITYALAPTVQAVGGQAETSIDGATCMEGTATLSEEQGARVLKCQGQGIRDGAPGESDPAAFAFDVPIDANAVVVFGWEFAAVAPRLLPEAGELANVTWVEFPDDLYAPELTVCKPGYRLVREAPNDDGHFTISVFGSDDIPGRAREPISAATYDADGNLISLSLVSEWVLVETDEAGTTEQGGEDDEGNE
jgi:hypothetical protein